MQETKTTKLHKITLIYALMDEYPDEVTLHTANVYSYMLCKYNWFKSKQQKYYETQDTIAAGCRVSLSAVKTAVKFLLKYKLITVTKVASKEHNRNQYTVDDKYCIYDTTRTVPQKQHLAVIDEDDPDLPW